ncbi:MAG: hypothetical protein HY926_05285 [Elusimicrobia bacterium]|nr:hypothetical protein [Elusimicrobiota bacterium]
MRRTTLLSLMLAPLLAGCFSFRRSKAIVITPEPGATNITVVADAVAKCTDLILITVCKLDLDLKRTGGISPNNPQVVKIREYIAANYARIISDLSAGSGQNLSALLELLRIPADQRVEAIFKLKEFNLRARNNPPGFTSLTIDNLFKPS